MLPFHYFCSIIKRKCPYFLCLKVCNIDSGFFFFFFNATDTLTVLATYWWHIGLGKAGFFLLGNTRSLSRDKGGCGRHLQKELLLASN